MRKRVRPSKKRKRACSDSSSAPGGTSGQRSRTSGIACAIAGAKAPRSFDDAGVRLAQVAADDLSPEPIGRGALALVASRREDTRTLSAGLDRQLIRQPCLADSRLAHQHHDAAAAGEGLGEALSQRRKLLGPAHQDPLEAPGRARRQPARRGGPGHRWRSGRLRPELAFRSRSISCPSPFESHPVEH